MKTYTNSTNDIYDGAKQLLLNEWNQSNGKLKLRLIGVRVSDLKEESSLKTFNSQSNNKSPPKSSRQQVQTGMKTLDTFFAKKSGIGKDDLGEIDPISFSIWCSNCSNYFECNSEFYDQHMDECLNLEVFT
jgi:hypothetical protein